MRRAELWLIALCLGTVSFGCKDRHTAAAEARVKQAQELMAQGRAALHRGDPDRAVAAFQQAGALLPKDPAPQERLADAYEQAGNEPAAVLTLKQAEALSPPGDRPALVRRRAELHRRMGQLKLAIQTFLELQALEPLSPADVFTLARLQASTGDTDAAFKTLEQVQRKNPDDRDAKVVEAEILLAAGEELLAAKLMDRLVSEHPAFTGARVLRARYFLASGYPDLAHDDLGLVPAQDARRPEVVELKARVLNRLKKHEDAVRVLEPLLDEKPRDAELLSLLAETHVALGNLEQADALLNRALSSRPRFPRALFVRGRAFEVRGDLAKAAASYERAIDASPTFAPALSAIWRVYLARGDKAEAMSALERLLYVGEASLEEKVSLAELYAETRSRLDRGRKLIAEALRREPHNARYKAIQAALGKERPSGITIIR